ncbi:hypothetical protein [Aestuariibacter salexigens]|uniref:hypothetical protein n=1 Tax=Aestuariibacter salexigens TaxID=226010 RepID=UPI0004101B18|nr:hypothetical protein [Aestuariibacter salexigens]
MRTLALILITICSWANAAPFQLNESEPLRYALEAIESTDLDEDGALQITSASDELQIRFPVGFSVSEDARYIRFDLTNGRFASSLTADGLVPNPDYRSYLVSGGNIDDTFAIIEINSIVLLPGTTEVTVDIDSFFIEDISEPLELEYRLYDRAFDAVNEGSILTRSTDILAEVVPTNGKNYTRAFTHTAGFEQNFLRFNPTFRAPSIFALGDATETLASMAKVLLSQLVNDDVRRPGDSGIISDFRDLIPDVDTSQATASIKGDFSTVDAFLSVDNNCSSEGVIIASYEAVSEKAVSIDDLSDYPVFCIRAESNDVALTRNIFQLDLGVDITLEDALFGTIRYDAASIDLPYITSFDGYRQRIILVNHAGYDIEYRTVFLSEESVQGEYSEGPKASGVIPANSTLKINADELVVINEGVPTRVSARIFVDAKRGDLSAAVQILELGNPAPPVTNILTVNEN